MVIISLPCAVAVAYFTEFFCIDSDISLGKRIAYAGVFIWTLCFPCACSVVIVRCVYQDDIESEIATIESVTCEDTDTEEEGAELSI